MEQKEIINLLYIIGLIVLVIGVGMFALNQTMTWFYKAEFLQSPCGLCEKLNKDFVCSPQTKVDSYILNNITIGFKK
jgi:hypothetical protein